MAMNILRLDLKADDGRRRMDEVLADADVLITSSRPASLEPHLRMALARELGVDVEDRAALTAALSERSVADWHRWADVRGLPLTAVRT
jgi:hypothetical protein